MRGYPGRRALAGAFRRRGLISPGASVCLLKSLYIIASYAVINLLIILLERSINVFIENTSYNHK